MSQFEPKNIPLRGLFSLPKALDSASIETRAKFWRLIGIEARHLKEREILSGIDRWGNKFQPVKRKWGNPTPLIPHGEDSRTYRLLTLNWTAQGATLYWRVGAGRMSWKTILGYHAYKHGPRSLPVRDEFGLSPKSIEILGARASAIWKTIGSVGPKPRPLPKPTSKPRSRFRLSVADDRRRMAEADRLTREAMDEAIAIMAALAALSFVEFLFWQYGEPIE
jgi:hypothetical protein